MNAATTGTGTTAATGNGTCRETITVLRAGEIEASCTIDRWLRRFIHATIDDGVPRISRRHETRATRIETFATFIADFSFPPTFPVHSSPQGPEGRR